MALRGLALELWDGEYLPSGGYSLFLLCGRSGRRAGAADFFRKTLALLLSCSGTKLVKDLAKYRHSRGFLQKPAAPALL